MIVHLAQQLGVVPEKIIPYDWEGRTIKAHRAAIRTFLEVHEATLADEETIVAWLCQQVLGEQRQEEALMASVYSRCKAGRIEPPTPDRVRRLVHTAIHRFDERLCASIMQRLSAETRTHLDALLTVAIPAPEEHQETLSYGAGSASGAHVRGDHFDSLASRVPGCCAAFAGNAGDHSSSGHDLPSRPNTYIDATRGGSISPSIILEQSVSVKVS